MRTFTKSILALCLAVCFTNANAQLSRQKSSVSQLLPKSGANERCKASHKHDFLMQTDPVYQQNRADIEEHYQKFLNLPSNQKSAAVYTIPVVVHVMHLGESVGTATNISDAQIQSAINNLTDAYGSANTGFDTDIEFCLAVRDPNGNPTTGINRINASGHTSGGDNYGSKGITDNNETGVKALSKWDNTQYYNFWIVSEIDNNGGGSGTQGYAYYPGASSAKDGAVVLYNSFGYDPDGSIGYELKSYTRHNATTVHEMGHGLNLRHTFEGDAPDQNGNSTQCPTNTSCSTQGDLICDTDPHRREVDCGDAGVPCGGTGTKADMATNIMAYSSDYCQTKFTAGQGARMRAVLAPGGTREDLNNSLGCTPAAAPVSDFYANGTSGCAGSTVNFFDNSINGVTSWAWTFENGSPSSSTIQNPSVIWNTGGTYDVSLTATNGIGTGNTETKVDYITVYNAPTSATCNPTSQNPGGNYDLTIYSVEFGDINNTTDQSASGEYQDFSCTHTTTVDPNSTYTLTLGMNATYGGYDEASWVYIDYDNNGTFDLSERVATFTQPDGNLGTLSTNVTIPGTAVTGTLLRMRVVGDAISVGGPCESNFVDDTEDYGVYITPPPCTPPAVTSNPSNRTICEAGSTNFSITSTDGTSYQWQVNAGGGYVSLSNSSVYSGVTTQTLSVSNAPASLSGNLYRCVVTGNCAPTATSAGATLTVNPTPVANAGNNGTICAFDTVTLNGSVNTTGGVWSTGGDGTFFPNTSTLSAEYHPGSNDIANGTVNLTLTTTGNGACSADADVMTLTINGSPAISSQPSNATITENNNTSFSVTASNATSYQWQVDGGMGAGFSNITNGGVYSNATTSTLDLSNVPLSYNGYSYRCVVTGNCGSVVSNGASLTVEVDGGAEGTSFMLKTYDDVNGWLIWWQTSVLRDPYVRIRPQDVAGATSYTVEVDTDSLFGSPETKNGTWFGDFKYFLSPNTTYFVRVKANNEANFGVTKTFTTAGVSVGTATMKRTYDDTYGWQAGWNNPTTDDYVRVQPLEIDGATSYTVQVDDDPNFGSPTTKVGFYFVDFKFSGLALSTTYYVRVMADNEGVYGGTRTFTTHAGGGSIIRNPDPISERDNDKLAIATYDVYPNPFSNEMNIRVDNKKQENLMVMISDLSGRVVYQSSRHQTNQTIQLGEELEDGMYLINLVHGDESKLIKVIKK